MKMGAKMPSGLSAWGKILMVGLTGNVIPFFLINWSIQYVPSSQAAICIALLPLFTIILAHYMTDDEKFQTTKLIGVIFGIFGVASLYYGTISQTNGISENGLLALTGLIAAAFSLALFGILVKRLGGKDRLGMAAAMLIAASVAIIPLALIIDRPWTLSPTSHAIMSVVILGAFATGAASFILFHLTHLAGVNFVANTTYLIPLVGIASGYFFLDEPLKMTYFFSIILIFAGIYLVERKKRQ